jgi:hypothetical protein
MRIAVLVYGRLNKCAEHYDNIMDHIGREHQIDFFGSSDHSNEELINQFIELYKPKSFVNDPIVHTYDFNHYQGSPNFNFNTLDNMIRHFMNKDRVFSLLERYIEKEGVYYDIVISLRVDIFFNTKIIFQNIQENTIYIPINNDHEGGINDQIAYSNVNVMKKYMNIIHNCIYLLENELSKVHPESLNYANIKYENINIHRFDLSYNIYR